MLPLMNSAVSKPCRPVKDGVSLNMSTIFNVVSGEFDGTGPPPVLFCSFLNPLNYFFPMLCLFWNLSFTSWVVLNETPTAFTAATIFFVFVMLLLNLLCKISIFS